MKKLLRPYLSPIVSVMRQVDRVVGQAVAHYKKADVAIFHDFAPRPLAAVISFYAPCGENGRGAACV